MSAAIAIRRPPGAVALPDNDQWEMRFEIKSESSNRVYTVARNKKTQHWGCSCPGYCAHRKCKHLRSMGVPETQIHGNPAAKVSSARQKQIGR